MLEYSLNMLQTLDSDVGLVYNRRRGIGMKLHEIEWVEGNRYKMKLNDNSNSNIVVVSRDELMFDENARVSSVYKLKVLLTADFEPIIDWFKVEVDTPIWVRDAEYGSWKRRHFCDFVKGTKRAVLCWKYGLTSHTANDLTEGTTQWSYATLTNPNKESEKI